MMNYWRRGMAGFMAVLVTVGMSGCQNTESKNEKEALLDKDNPTTITVWNYYNGDQLAAFEDLVNTFNETAGAQKGIVVQSVGQGSIDNLVDSLLDSVDEKAGAQKLPSIVSVYAETAYILQEKDAIISLDSYFTPEELQEYVPGFLEEGRFTEGGKLMMFPVFKSTENFVVNETDWKLFADATGITSESIDSVEDLTAASKAYYEWTDSLTPTVAEDGKALYGRDALANYIYIGAKQLGHEMFKVGEDGVEVDLDRDTFKTLWDNYYIPYINGYMGAYGSYRSEDMKTGSIIALTGSTSGTGYIPTSVTNADDSSYDIQVGIYAPLEFENAVEHVAVQQGAEYAVLKTSEAEELASVEFMKWFTDAEQNIEFSINSGYSPVKSEANSEQAIKDAFTVESDKDTNVLDSLLISADIFLNKTTYTSKPFDGSKDIRSYLEKTFGDKAAADRAAVVAAIESGQSKEEAAAPYSTDEYFDNWFKTVSAQVDSIIEK
ncbi:MAG: extracellular solute-binding protein [Lachnospiraceae bacterium]|nr:extracellular solute-binding protein [Lachnospiraceae bacterium]MDD3616251.1 extracellular solute-binding protein [Lachnospiraceae bacterium]